jgi:hypothetical protein
MDRKKFLNIFFFAIFTGSGLYGIIPGFSRLLSLNGYQQDTTKENQILYNGKVWRNLYYHVKGDQFLFSNSYLPGSVAINGKTYNNLNINYDIYNDEIITPNVKGTILQLNKEMVDSFTMVFEDKTYRFINTLEDSLSGVKGYMNELYKGESALYVKYKKEIDPLAVDKKYDLFYQKHRIYFMKGGIYHQISGKNDLLKVLSDEKTQIKDFIKQNKIKIIKREPESYIPVIRYYDSLSH